MASIAEGYLGITDETIKELQSENKDNAEAFNREIFRDWTRRNPQDQVKVIVLAIIYSQYLVKVYLKFNLQNFNTFMF